MVSTKEPKKSVATQLAPVDTSFGNFVKEIDNAIRSWSTSPNILSLFEANGVRLPLCEIEDRGEAYELQVEIPGMGKDNVSISGKPYLVMITAEKSNLANQSTKGLVYTERSESSFYRQIPLPEEIAPQKIRSTVKDGILHATIPKKSTTIKSGRKTKSRR